MARPFRYLKDSEKSLIADALRIARDQYRKHVATCETNPQLPHLAEQFKRQAEEAEALADLFDSYPEVEIDTAA